MADACSICFTVSGHTYATLKMVRHGWRFVGKGKQNIALGKWHFRIASLLWWRRVIAQSSSHKVTFAIDHVFVCWNSCLSLSNSLFKIAQEFYKLWTTYQKTTGRYDESIHHSHSIITAIVLCPWVNIVKSQGSLNIWNFLSYIFREHIFPKIQPTSNKMEHIKTHPFSASVFPAGLPLCDSSYWSGRVYWSASQYSFSGQNYRPKL